LEVTCNPISQNGNLYTVTFTLTSPQGYGTGTYDCTNIAVGMWFSNTGNGYAWRFYSISSQTISECTCVIEDVNGFNANIDPSGGIDGGGPGTNIGYIYELNVNGLPVLLETPNPPSIIWTDAQLARFLYLQTNSGGGGSSKSFTMYLKYADTFSINEIIIPAGLFGTSSHGTLAQGGIFSSNQGSDLVFYNLPSITMNNLTNAVALNFTVLGYITIGEWRQVPTSSYGTPPRMYMSYNSANSLVLNNLTLGSINGGNTAVTSTFPYSGYLAAITVTFV
jgi:hypothetical protein